MVYSDSSYLINCMRRGWYNEWRQNGWCNRLRRPVANRDLWERLLEATERHWEVRWRKVQGHSKSVGPHKSGNDRAVRRLDRLPGRGLSSQVLRRTIEYVEENLAGDLSLAEIAGAANMSPRHFSRLFKEAVGLPPHRYVVERRVERAKELLLGTDLPIAEVVRGVDFSSQSHLHFHVKRLLGATPASLRSRGPARP
jgi:transcriptional regulator GlxA family with amidase domain